MPKIDDQLKLQSITEILKEWNSKQVTLDGQDAKIYASEVNNKACKIKTMSGDRVLVTTYTNAHIVMTLNNGVFTEGFEVEAETMYPDLEEDEMMVPSITTVLPPSKPVSLEDMMGFIQADGITLNGNEARVGICGTDDETFVPKILDLTNKQEYYVRSWEKVREVIEEMNGFFSTEDLVEEDGVGLPENKPAITVEDILALAEGKEITLEGHPAELKMINAEYGNLTSKVGPIKAIRKTWKLIYDVITNHNGAFFINDHRYMKTKPGKSFGTNNFITLHGPFHACLEAHRKTKEEFTKLMGMCVDKQKDAVFIDVQHLFTELNKLEVLIELCKEEHGSTTV